MTNDDERQHLEALLHIHRKNARIYETQIAQHGLNPPLNLLYGLEHEQREIALLQAQLYALGFPARAAGITPLVIEPFEITRERPPGQLRLSAPARPMPPRRPVQRSVPPIRRILLRTRAHAVRWWVAGGVAFALAVLLSISFLLRPTPNDALVDRLRAEGPATHSYILRVADIGAEPVRLNAVVGDVIALTVVNDSQEPRRLAIFDAEPEEAARLFARGVPAHHDAITRLSPLLLPGEQTVQTFVPYHTGRFSIASVAEDHPPVLWGVIEVR